MNTDRIGLHSVLLPLLRGYDKNLQRLFKASLQTSQFCYLTVFLLESCCTSDSSNVKLSYIHHSFIMCLAMGEGTIFNHCSCVTSNDVKTVRCSQTDRFKYRSLITKPLLMLNLGIKTMFRPKVSQFEGFGLL